MSIINEIIISMDHKTDAKIGKITSVKEQLNENDVFIYFILE